MKRFSFVLMLFGFLCLSVWGCNLLGSSYDDEYPSSGLQNFTPAEQQQIVSNLLSEKANLAIPMVVPRMSFYRFDLTNESGANRVATIISYAQAGDATASPTYGPESTAKVYLYEAKKKQVGYDFDYFTFEQTLTDEVVNNVVKAMLPYLTDPEFLLKSQQNLDEVPTVAASILQEIAKLPNPVQADFTASLVGPGSLVLKLWPRFQSLGNEAMLKLVFNSDMQRLTTLYQNFDLNNFPLLKSNVSMENLTPRPARRQQEVTREQLILCIYLTLESLNNTLSYDGNGHTGGSVPATYTFMLGCCGEEETIPVSHNTGNLIKEGFVWGGWSGSPGIFPADSIEDSGYFKTSLRKNYVLSAIWNLPAVTYNGNGSTSGNPPIDSSSPYQGGSTVTVLGNSGNLVRTGYTFAGWNTAANGGGTDRAVGSTFTMGDTNTVLYAKWIAVAKPTVTITSANVNDAGYSRVDPTDFVVTFSSGVTGFTVEDITFTGNGSVGNFVQVDSSHYTFSIQNLTFYSACKIDISADVVDSPGNEAAASFNFQLTH